jgi:Holliday junction resolvasome RuvABC endonuclease subunit
MIIAGLDLSMVSSGIVKFYLDNDLNIKKQAFIGFTDKKDYVRDNVYYYKKDKNTETSDNYERFSYIKGKIIDFICCPDVDYIAIEGYSYGSKGSLAFTIGEFGGIIKNGIYENLDNVLIREYSPDAIKKFAVGNGKADKLMMEEGYEKEKDKIKLNFYPSFTEDEKSPKNNIIDAWYITKLLQTELKLRKGLIELKNLNDKQIEVFNTVSEKKSVNLLARNFYGQ